MWCFEIEIFCVFNAINSIDEHSFLRKVWVKFKFFHKEKVSLKLLSCSYVC